MSRQSESKTGGFAHDSPAGAIGALLDRLTVVEGTESLEAARATGRVLSAMIRTDRPSPPCSVSAMDGYVARFSDVRSGGRIAVPGQVPIGKAPPDLPQGAALSIVTGAPIPDGGDIVIKREDVEEHEDQIVIPEQTATSLKVGRHIRSCGENLAADQEVVGPGELITPPVVAALASFGHADVAVFRKVQVGIIVTGDELLPIRSTPQPWEIRDSNGPTLASLLGSIPWVEIVTCQHAVDQAGALQQMIRETLATCDALFLTGGVSMGDHDYVPEAISAAGAGVVFHKLPTRPGKPVLAAIGPDGQAILGLPGNPVSVLVGARWLGIPALGKRAGLLHSTPPSPLVTLANPDEQTLGLWWYRLVRLTCTGVVELVSTKGSGDMVSAARSDGFIEIPPGRRGPGPWPYYSWT